MVSKVHLRLQLSFMTNEYQPCESLYGLYQHPIDPQHESLVELVQGKELDVLVDDDGGPGVVDAVVTIFTRKTGLLSFKQSSKTG